MVVGHRGLKVMWVRVLLVDFTMGVAPCDYSIPFFWELDHHMWTLEIEALKSLGIH